MDFPDKNEIILKTELSGRHFLCLFFFFKSIISFFIWLLACRKKKRVPMSKMFAHQEAHI